MSGSLTELKLEFKTKRSSPLQQSFTFLNMKLDVMIHIFLISLTLKQFHCQKVSHGCRTV